MIVFPVLLGRVLVSDGLVRHRRLNAEEVALAGKSAYRYGPPGPPFRKFGLEQQPTLVEEWAVGTQGRATVPITGRAMNPPVGMQENDPYFAYVANNIRMGLA